MPGSFRSRMLVAILYGTSIAAAGVGAYFAGRSAEAKYEDRPAPEVKLEEQGRYDEAIQMVLDERKKGLPEAEADSEVAVIYLDRAQRDRPNREKWAQQVTLYIEKAASLAPNDPFILESAMDDLNTAGDYSDNGCVHYQKAIQFGEPALALLQGNTVTVEGHVRSYPTQPIKESIEPQLNRIRDKVQACCNVSP